VYSTNTIQHSDEITSERRTKKSLRDKWFWTADFPLYHVEGDEVVLYLARGKDNLIFKNLEDATQQLINTNNYTPNKEEAENVIKQETTLKVRLSQLNLIKDNDEFSHFEIDTADYDKLNTDERAFAERVYGQGQEFVKNMEMLNKAGKGKVNVYVLNQDYVKSHAKENDFVARAGGLDGFDRDSRFGAVVRNVGNSYLSVRGVRRSVKEAPEGRSAPKIEADPIAEAYHTLLKKCEEAAEKMTPKIAADVSNILTVYLNKQKP
jgi:hypothetical protein